MHQLTDAYHTIEWSRQTLRLVKLLQTTPQGLPCLEPVRAVLTPASLSFSAANYARWLEESLAARLFKLRFLPIRF